MAGTGETVVLGMNAGHLPLGQKLHELKREKRRQKSDRFIAKLEKREKYDGVVVVDKSPLAEQKSKKTSKHTISIALPCSILDNAQSMELKCYVAAQIARSVAIFAIDEIVVFNDTTNPLPSMEQGELTYTGKKSHSAVMMAAILQYIECPPYLRKTLFPQLREFEMAANMLPLKLAHHGQDEHALYKEGIVTTQQPKAGKGSYVNVGLSRDVQVDRCLEPGIRVTVRLDPPQEGQKKRRGVVVSPSTPKHETGVYWGYSVRIATSFSRVFSGCPYASKYDLIIGTSENGTIVGDFWLRPFKNLLVVFGGIKGIEYVIEADETLKATDPRELFDFYVNTCPYQGSRTIRTEEALLISMAALQPAIMSSLKQE